MAKSWRGYLALCGKINKAVARSPVARLTCGEVTCYHNRNRSTLTMLRDIGNGTKSDIPPIYQVTVQYFVGISNISTIMVLVHVVRFLPYFI